DVGLDHLAALVAASWADGDDLALGRFFLRSVGDDDSPLGLFLGIDTLDDHTIVQRTKLGFGHIFPRRRLAHFSTERRLEAVSTQDTRVPIGCRVAGVKALPKEVPWRPRFRAVPRSR